MKRNKLRLIIATISYAATVIAYLIEKNAIDYDEVEE